MILLASAGILALGLLVLTWRSERWKEPGRWTALAVVGQAAGWQLVRAGKGVRYEHLALPWQWTGWERWAGFLVLAYGLVVAQAVWTRRARWLGPSASGGWRLAVGLLVFGVASTALSPSPLGYGIEMLGRSLVQAAGVGTALLIGLAMPQQLSVIVPRWWSLALGGLTTVITAAMAVLVYERHPHVPDEVAYLIQAGYFAAGKLAIDTPAVPAAFNVDLLYYDAKQIYSVFPPGWPAVLALGVKAGLAWLVNPVLAGANVVLCHRLLRACYDQPTAVLGTFLFALSPWHLFFGMSFMSHTLTLTLAMGAALLVVGALTTDSWVRLIAAGLLIGAVSLIRPLDGLVLAATLGLVVVLAGGKVWHRISQGAMLATATAAAGALVLPYNAALTGRGSTFPVMLYFNRYYSQGSNDMGFGPNRGLGWSGLDPFPGHGAIDVAVNALINTFQVNTELLGWAAGSLIPILWFLLRPRRWQLADKAMSLVIATVIGLHSFYWFSGGPDFGARYWSLLLFPAIALAARGIHQLDGDNGPGPGTRLGPATLTAVALCCLALVTFVPWRATDKYWRFRGMAGDVASLAASGRFQGALVLIQGRRHPDYHGAAVSNPPDLRASAAPIYGWDRDVEVRDRLLASYPDRPVWVVAGPSVTGDGYRVVAGPLTAAAARELASPPSYPTPPGPNP